MRNFTLTMLLMFSSIFALSAQNVVKGIVINSDSEKPLQGVSVSVEGAKSITDANGAFTISNLADGRQVVVVSFNGFETQNFPVQLSGKEVDLGTILMYEDISEDQDLSIITITDDELDNDASAADNISGLLQSSRNVYLRSAAFEWSGSFYRIRGLDSENGKVLINGIEMNKLFNGRPQWSNWGGLNDVVRNQEFSNGLTASNFTFGGVLGSTNINTRASEYRAGGRISYASSNRSYAHRVMATHASGLLESGWAYAVSASTRQGNEGFVDGTPYDATSFFASVEKQINKDHSINFTAITAFNKRGRSAANTDEVFNLNGIKYNSYWGYQNGKIRNSRIRRIQEPILMLNHYWNINDNTSLQTNVSYQFGEIGNSRLDFNGSKLGGTDGDGNPFIVTLGGTNPDPTYYQKLPSYGVRQGYDETRFLNNSQIDWASLYRTNRNAFNEGRSTYILYEDRNDDKQFSANTIVSSDINDNITLNGKLQFVSLRSNNFAEITDLLGGNGYLDVDTFADSYDERQNNLLNPDFVATEGDKFRYNFILRSQVLNAFAQAQFKYNKVDFFLAADISNTSHQREGLFQNGGFANNSLGKSEEKTFTNFSTKGGLTYKLSGRHLFDVNAGYFSKAPTLRNTFSNSRENNNVVDNLTSEKILTADASYILRSPIVQAKLTGFYTQIADATEISFFFADGIGGDNTAFVQEILTGIDKRHFGGEFGIEAQVTPTIKLKAAGNVAQYTFNNNPNLYLTTEANRQSEAAGFINGRRDYGQSNLKNYRIAAGPQTALSAGFEYRDPDYWWVGATINYFDHTYLDISPLTRTSNFADDGGSPFNDYDPVIARQLLQQERFNDYTTVNLVGGKSWKVGKKEYLSIFASVTNLFDTKYKTGGFEQGRNANYRQLRDDRALDTPVFGNRYWNGRGTTYFLSTTFRF